MKKKFLFIEPRDFDRAELGRDVVTDHNEIFFFTFQDKQFPPIICEGVGKIGDHFDAPDVLNELLDCCQQESIEGVLFSQDYPGALFASALINEKQFNGPSMEAMLSCQHKYESRLKQREIVPEATPNFELIDPLTFDSHSFSMLFPVFVKPVKSSFSILANKADNETHLHELIRSFNLPSAFIEQFNWFLKQYSPFAVRESHILVEQHLSGIQATLEGFIFDHAVTIIGVVDSIMFSNNISFKQFEYPSQLPPEIQQRMGSIAERLVQGLGLNNTLFNIEFMYNPVNDSIGIIEIHSRMSAQFADLFEKVDGTNSYDILLMLAQGKKPILNHRKGKYNIAASFVLRTFENKLVSSTPSVQDQEKVYKVFADIRFYGYIQPGMKLSDVKQDGKSFRYGLVHLGARDKKELYEKLDECMKLLPFTFAKA